MAKAKSVYVCSNCGADSPKWIGKCPVCGEWNTYVEEIVSKAAPQRSAYIPEDKSKVKPVRIHEVTTSEDPRIDLCNTELNRVRGGGLVPGSLVLIGGEPGIGKSTLVLQTVLGIEGKRVLYVSGEESAKQLKLRADRLEHVNADCYIVCEY